MRIGPVSSRVPDVRFDRPGRVEPDGGLREWLRPRLAYPETVSDSLRSMRPNSVAGATSHEVILARSLAETEEIRPLWERVQWSRFDPDPDFYCEIIRSRPEIAHPHVVVLNTPDRGTTMLVARVEELPLPLSVGYKVLLRPTLRAITLVHGGVAGVDTTAACEALLRELWASLLRGDADVVYLPKLRTDSLLHEVAGAWPPFACRNNFSLVTHHWRLDLPESLDSFLASRTRNTRASVRSHRRRLLRDLGRTLEVDVLKRIGEIERIFKDLEEVAAKTYQRGLGVGFSDTQEWRRTIALALERGWFRAYVLYIDGRPRAFWFGYLYAGTFFIQSPGYDPAFKEYSLGVCLLMDVIDDLCRDDGAKILDYGFGEAEYKQRFGTTSWPEADVLIFAPRITPLAVNLSTTGAALVTTAAKKLLGGRRTAVLKRRWRDHVRPTG
jgi:CelD/BcsL family acetyltransferase involved in cellulose biosynthesis